MIPVEKDLDETREKTILVERGRGEKLKKTLDALMEQNKLLELQVNVLKSSNQEKFLYLERMRLRRVTLTWTALCLIALGFMIDSILRIRIFPTLMCFTAFLLNWRALYIEDNTGPSLISLGILIFGVFFF